MLSFMQTLGGVVVAARLLTAAPPAQPLNTIGGGCVLADLTVDMQGHVGKLNALSGKEPFLQPATQAIQQWMFSPATSDQHAVTSRVGVLALFRPAAFGSLAVGGPAMGFVRPVLGKLDHPALPVAVVDPGYPAQSTAMGVVVLELTIDRNGQLAGTRIIQDVPSLTGIAADAVKGWQFTAAVESGRAVEGRLIVAISFLRPVVQTNPN